MSRQRFFVAMLSVVNREPYADAFDDACRCANGAGMMQAPVLIVATGTNATFFPQIQELPLLRTPRKLLAAHVSSRYALNAHRRREAA